MQDDVLLCCVVFFVATEHDLSSNFVFLSWSEQTMTKCSAVGEMKFLNKPVIVFIVKTTTLKEMSII